MRINIHRDIYPFFFRLFRTRRMQKFCELFHLQTAQSILDVGGSSYNWSLIPVKPKVVFVNLLPPHQKERKQGLYVIADGRRLPFKTGSFEIVYSNSVIEHLGTYSAQRQFASEISRVGRYYYVQTPNKWFPVEPHYLALFIHWLPAALQKRLIRNFTLRGWLTRPTPEQINHFVQEIRLLKEKELRNCFPEAQILREKFLLLSKSFIAARCRK